jgi:threonine dehydrogenase-like Zn-dependent dehydrogenase
VVMIGLGGHATRVDTALLVRRQLVLRGSLIYDHPHDFAATLTSAIPSPERILRASYPLREAPEAFRAAREVPGKTWIRVTV